MEAIVAEAAATSTSFDDLLDAWIALLPERGRSPKYIHDTRQRINRAGGIREKLGPIPVEDLTAEHIDRAIGEWLATGLSPSSVVTYCRTVSAALSQGVKWRWLPASPMASVTLPKIPKQEHAIATAEDIRCAVRVASEKYGPSPRMASAIWVAYTTGAREGEIAALRWSDVDLDGGALRIERAIGEVGGTLYTKDTKTGDRRVLSIDPILVDLLRGLRDDQETYAELVGVELVTNPYIVTDDPRGHGPLPPSTISHRWRVVRSACEGLASIRFHDLRHTHVSELLSAGVDVRTVAGRVGHSSARMTLDRYAHVLPATDQAAAAVVGGLLKT
jgi:integrase